MKTNKLFVGFFVFLAAFAANAESITYEEELASYRELLATGSIHNIRSRLDHLAWSGITEDYTVGWADVTKYFLTNNITGAWIGSFFANKEKWDALPAHLQELLKLAMDSSHYYRQHWYWGGEAKLRTGGTKLTLTSIPDNEWARVEEEALKFWDEVSAKSPRSAKVVNILKDYAGVMAKAGRPYRYT